MSKYIDAEELKAEINEHINLMCLEKTAYAKARVDEAKDILNEIASLQQEPEMDLEEEIARYLREECSSDNEPSISEIAHHFWNKGYNARKEE